MAKQEEQLMLFNMTRQETQGFNVRQEIYTDKTQRHDTDRERKLKPKN